MNPKLVNFGLPTADQFSAAVDRSGPRNMTRNSKTYKKKKNDAAAAAAAHARTVVVVVAAAAGGGHVEMR
jgi:hypothetical protein